MLDTAKVTALMLRIDTAWHPPLDSYLHARMPCRPFGEDTCATLPWNVCATQSTPNH